jgi:hypothetical protein
MNEEIESCAEFARPDIFQEIPPTSIKLFPRETNSEAELQSTINVLQLHAKIPHDRPKKIYYVCRGAM